jgi:hypothetical protein
MKCQLIDLQTRLKSKILKNEKMHLERKDFYKSISKSDTSLITIVESIT